MARIKVDHWELHNAADTVDQRIMDHDGYIGQANAEVSGMVSVWSGDDYLQYKIQWERVTENGSTSKYITARLKAYSDFLRFSEQQYKNAQCDAVNRVNRIPVW